MNSKSYHITVTLKRLFFITILTLLLPGSNEIYSQKLSWNWATALSGTPIGICLDRAGNIYVPSGFAGVTKYTPQGKPSSKTFEGLTGNIVGKSIALDSKGNVYVAAEFSDYMLIVGKDSLKREDGQDVCIIKYDSTGKAIWGKTIIGEGIQRCYKIRVDNADNIVVIGTFSKNSITLDSTIVYNTKMYDSGDDIFIAKYNSNGKVLWAQSAGGTKDEAAYGLAIDRHGSIYITGFSRSDSASFDGEILHNQTTYPGQGDAEIFVAKYTSDGRVVWLRSLHSNSWLADDIGHGIIADSNGNVYVTGSYGYNGMPVDSIELKSERYKNIFLMKLDSAGKAIWAKSAVAEISRSLTLFNNTISICGFSSDNYLRFDSLKIPTPEEDRDICFIARYDTSGNFIGAAVASGENRSLANSIYCSDIASDQNGYTYISGGLSGHPPYHFGNITIPTGNTVYKGFIAGIDNSVISSINIPYDFGNPFFPKPTTGKLIISGLEGTGWSIELYNLKGKCIFNHPISSVNPTLDLSTQEKGIYFFSLKKDENVVKTGKIMLD